MKPPEMRPHDRVDPIHYPVHVCAVRRTEGKYRYVDIADARGEVLTSVLYTDRTPGYHLTCMRTAQAIADALNLCEINIVTDGQPKAKPPGETYTGDLDHWKHRALNAEGRLRVASRELSNNSWDLSNYREEAQRRRDAEIGDQGGGG